MNTQSEGGETRVTKSIPGRKSGPLKSTEEKAKETPESTEERDSYSIQEFCRRHNISNGTYYNLRDRGQGPREGRAMKRVLISKEAAADWRRQIETTSDQ